MRVSSVTRGCDGVRWQHTLSDGEADHVEHLGAQIPGCLLFFGFDPGADQGPRCVQRGLSASSCPGEEIGLGPETRPSLTFARTAAHATDLANVAHRQRGLDAVRYRGHGWGGGRGRGHRQVEAGHWPTACRFRCEFGASRVMCQPNSQRRVCGDFAAAPKFPSRTASNNALASTLALISGGICSCASTSPVSTTSATIAGCHRCRDCPMCPISDRRK